MYRSLSLRPNPSIGAVKLSLRVARFFSVAPSTGLPYDAVLLVDVLIATPITGAWLWLWVSCAVLGRRVAPDDLVCEPDVRSGRGEDGTCELSLGKLLCGVALSSLRSGVDAWGDAGRGGRGGACVLVGRANVELLEPTVAPAVDGLRGSLPRAEDSVLLFLGLSNSGVDFLCSGGRG